MIKLSGVRGCGITLPRTPDVLYDVMCDRHVMNRQRIKKMKQHLLLIEDDERLGALVSEYLTDAALTSPMC